MLSGISRKRSIRSNLYWFTEFCNSQCLSHFAAPFIVVRAETSVAESCKANQKLAAEQHSRTEQVWTQVTMNERTRQRGQGERGYDGPLPPQSLPAKPCTRESTHVLMRLRPHPGPHRGAFTWIGWMRANDPSAGSPTETLLRLLLPLSDKVH